MCLVRVFLCAQGGLMPEDQKVSRGVDNELDVDLDTDGDEEGGEDDAD